MFGGAECGCAIGIEGALIAKLLGLRGYPHTESSFW